jgi:deaminated glutathione amidase
MIAAATSGRRGVSMPVLEVATCQFPVCADVAANLGWCERLLRRANDRGARLVHFAECALTGYAGADLTGHEDQDWNQVEDAIGRVATLAAHLGLWVALGSAYPVPDHRPHNSVLVIDPAGAVVDRYDKRFCSGDPDHRTGDLAHYSPGDHPTVVDIDGVRCGVLICYDYRFPELYREYMTQGVQLVLHSFHTGNISAGRLAVIGSAIGEHHAALNPAMTYPGITMHASSVGAAAANHLWISASNSSTRHSAWGAFMVRADGVTVGRLPRHRPGVLVTAVDTDADLYDSTRFWRSRAAAGVLHSGEPPRRTGPG